MLTSRDYRRDNWDQVTWQIFSGVYANGYVESSVLPPTDYLQWLIDRYGLHSPESIWIVSGQCAASGAVWRIKVRQALEGVQPKKMG